MDTSTPVRVSVLPARDRDEHEWPSVSCHPKVLIVWKGDVIRKHECALAGSDNSRCWCSNFFTSTSGI